MEKSKYLKLIEVEETTREVKGSFFTKPAEERARRDPQPGDRWHEMLSYWIHVDAREGDRVLTRAYRGPCTIRPEEAKEDIWHESVADFIEYVQYMMFGGNSREIALAGGVYEESNHPFR